MNPFEAEFAELGAVVRKLEAAGHSTEAAVEQAVGYVTEHLKSFLPAKATAPVAVEAPAPVAAPVVATPAAVVAAAAPPTE